MVTQFSQYTKYFKAGQRVKVAIPTADGRWFHDWAQLSSLADDLVELQLSRDTLPTGVRLGVGSTLELRTGSSGSGYRCRSIIVTMAAEKQLLLRLTGEVILDELREYFRIDVYLPLRLSIPESRDPAYLKEQWVSRRAELAARAKEAEDHVYGEEHAQPIESQWHDVPPKAANISGGGLKVTIPEKLPEGAFVNLSVYLPLHPPVLLDIVGQVITTTPVFAGEDTHYSTAFRFFHIDERDRDRIIQYVTAEQLSQLRHYQKRVASVDGSDTLFQRGKKRLLAVVGISLLCLGIIWLISRMASYHRERPKSEVQRIFEKGLKDYLEKFR